VKCDDNNKSKKIGDTKYILLSKTGFLFCGKYLYVALMRRFLVDLTKKNKKKMRKGLRETKNIFIFILVMIRDF